MEKIFIQGTSRTASKLYREVLNRVEGIYILHEMNFDFRVKEDVHKIFKKYKVYDFPQNIKFAIDEIYSNPFYKRIQKEYPDKNILINALERQKEVNWCSALSLIVETKARKENKKVAGAKNIVHFSFTPNLVRNLRDAKVLYLLRDPRAMYASEIVQKTTGMRYSKFPKTRSEKIQRVLTFFHTTIEWVWALMIYKQVKGKVFLCKYEELVNNPDGLFVRLFDYLGLSWSNEYLKGLSVISSSHRINDQGISRHGIEKWRQDLNVFESSWFNFLMKVFGYNKII